MMTNELLDDINDFFRIARSTCPWQMLDDVPERWSATITDTDGDVIRLASTSAPSIIEHRPPVDDWVSAVLRGGVPGVAGTASIQIEPESRPHKNSGFVELRSPSMNASLDAANAPVLAALAMVERTLTGRPAAAPGASGVSDSTARDISYNQAAMMSAQVETNETLQDVLQLLEVLIRRTAQLDSLDISAILSATTSTPEPKSEQ